MCVNDTGKRFRVTLPCRGYLQKIAITGKQHAVEQRSTGQEDRIVGFRVIVFLGRDDGDISSSQGINDSPRHVDIHVEPQAQADCGFNLNRRRKGESTEDAARRSASARLSAIF